ncbi:hypothetical protein GX51_04526 [Blastomyces parvus]|uniref:Uncharacterized protein n=1 Tax=Blastomyces parvus TaxID=2060905 RepID=A0A2B7X1I7_9EURO|nr:hypothetical protein GX51_04526 [Blastomyces parvus]
MTDSRSCELGWDQSPSNRTLPMSNRPPVCVDSPLTVYAVDEAILRGTSLCARPEIGSSESNNDSAKTMRFQLHGDIRINFAFLIKFQESPSNGKKRFTALSDEVLMVSKLSKELRDCKGLI